VVNENVWTFTMMLWGIVDQLQENNLLPVDALTLQFVYLNA